MMAFGNIYRDRRVLLTGHTGFKGSWLSLWLNLWGADVLGYALEPRTEKDNFVVSLEKFSNKDRLGSYDSSNNKEILKFY